MGKFKALTKLIGYATKTFGEASRANAGKIVKTYTNKAGQKIEVFQRTQRRWFAPNRTITTKFVEGSDNVLQQTVQQKKGNVITTFTKNADGTSMRSEVNRKNGWKDVAVFDASGKTTKTVYRGKNSNVTTIDTNPASKDEGLITLTRWKNEQKGLRGISVERQSNPLVLEDYYLDGKNIAHKGITTRTNVNEAFSPNMTKDLSWKNEGKDLTKALAEANKGKGGFSWGKALGWGTAGVVATGGGLYALASEEDKAAVKEFFGFASSRLSTWVLDILIMWFFVNIVPLNSLIIKVCGWVNVNVSGMDMDSVNYWVVKICISAVLVTILNYVFSKLFIFKKPKKRKQNFNISVV